MYTGIVYSLSLSFITPFLILSERNTSINNIRIGTTNDSRFQSYHHNSTNGSYYYAIDNKPNLLFFIFWTTHLHISIWCHVFQISSGLCTGLCTGLCSITVKTPNLYSKALPATLYTWSYLATVEKFDIDLESNFSSLMKALHSALLVQGRGVVAAWGGRKGKTLIQV